MKPTYAQLEQHYDVTENVRRKAIEAGAIEVDIYEWMEIVINVR